MICALYSMDVMLQLKKISEKKKNVDDCYYHWL